MAAAAEAGEAALAEGEARSPANWDPRESNFAFNSSEKSTNHFEGKITRTYIKRRSKNF